MRPCRVLGSFFTVGLLAASSAAPAIPLPFFGWDAVQLPPISKTSAAPCLFATDNMDDAYVLSKSTTTNYDYWTVDKIGPYGDFIWRRTFTFGPGSTPASLVVDTSLNVYALGTILTRSYAKEGEVVKLSPTGQIVFTHTVTSPVFPGLGILAGATDSSNNLFIAYAQPVPGGSPDLEVVRYTPTFIKSFSFDDAQIEPFSAAFDGQQNVVASGFPQSAYGSQVDMLSRTGALLFSKPFYDVNSKTSSVFPDANFILGASPGQVIVGEDIRTVVGAVNTQTFKVMEFNSGGGTMWDSPTQPGEIVNMEAAGSGNVFVRSFQFDSHGNITNFLGCVGANGAFTFNKAGPYSLFFAEPGRAWVTRDDATKSTLDVAIVNPAGAEIWSKAGLGNGGGIYDVQGAVSSANLVEIVGQTNPVNSISYVFEEREVEGLAVKSVSGGVLEGGQTGGGVVSLNGPAPAPVSVKLLLNGPAQGSMSVPSTVTVPKGATSATFPIKANPVDSNKTGTVVAEEGGAKREGTLEDTTAKLSSVELDNVAIVGGNTWGGTINLTGAAGPSGTEITMTSDHPAIIGNATYTIDSGSTSAKFADLSTKPTVDTDVKLTFTDKKSNVIRTATITVTAK